VSQVLSTDQATTTVQQMQALLNGDLTSNLQTLINQGNTLAEPTVWNGQLAAQFRDSWPSTSQQLQTTVQDLLQLTQECATIVANILSAGGNG
jgi:uncharacterized protein YukE